MQYSVICVFKSPVFVCGVCIMALNIMGLHCFGVIQMYLLACIQRHGVNVSVPVHTRGTSGAERSSTQLYVPSNLPCVCGV